MTITNIKTANKAAGYHFFDRDTLAFFSTRVESRVFSGISGHYFVTSENMRQNRREFYVRMFDASTSQICSCGCWTHKEDATARAKAMAREERRGTPQA